MPLHKVTAGDILAMAYDQAEELAADTHARWYINEHVYIDARWKEEYDSLEVRTSDGGLILFPLSGNAVLVDTTRRPT